MLKLLNPDSVMIKRIFLIVNSGECNRRQVGTKLKFYVTT